MTTDTLPLTNHQGTTLTMVRMREMIVTPKGKTRMAKYAGFMLLVSVSEGEDGLSTLVVTLTLMEMQIQEKMLFI